MRISTLALAGLFGGLLLVGDASACVCHKKKAVCPAPVVTCAPAPVVTYVPAPVVTCAPAPVVVCAPAPKAKHHFKMPKLTMHHKKAAPVCAPTYYTAPVAYPTPQATGQTM